MKRTTKIWLTVAISLFLIGCTVVVTALSLSDWRLSALSTDHFVTNTHKLNNEFDAITVITNTASVLLVPVDGKECTVDCYELENELHSVTVKDGALVIEVLDTRKWYHHIGIGFTSPKITVSVPRGAYGALSVRSDTGDVQIPRELTFSSIEVLNSTGDITARASASDRIKIKTDTGNVFVENVSTGALELAVTTGNVTVSSVNCVGAVSLRASTGKTSLTDLKCDSIVSGGSTGEITLTRVSVNARLSIERSTGDVHLDNCVANEISIDTDTGDVRLSLSDAATIRIQTDTGDVTGSLLTEKIFVTETDTGRVSVPTSTSGGKCEITTDTGDIRLTIANQE